MTLTRTPSRRTRRLQDARPASRAIRKTEPPRRGTGAAPLRPVFGALDDDASRALLGRHRVGRIAFLNGRIVEIEPVHYGVDGDWIFVRSGAGTRTEALGHRPYVAFEVDEVNGTFDWQSVVVHGTAYLKAPEGPPSSHRAFTRAVRALRKAIPEALTSDDPTPSRRIVYGIHIDTIVGRFAMTPRGPGTPAYGD